MSDSLFSKIKKFISKTEESQETKKENITSKNIEEDIALDNQQSKNNLNTTSNSLSFDIDEDISKSLEEALHDNSQVIYGCLIEKEQLIIKGFYSKSALPSDYVTLLLDNLVNITLNTNIINSDNLEKLLIVSDENYQYLITDENKIIILITTQKNQLITWKLLENINEKTVLITEK